MTVPSWFELEFDGATCVAVDLNRELDTIFAALHPEERAHAQGLKPRRHRTYAGGRVAARLAARAHDAPITSNHRGAPTMLGGPPLSISHKETIAVGLAGTGAHLAVGVDVEAAQPRARDIGGHVLTDDERAEVASSSLFAPDLETVLRFSLKEALYKVLDPFKERYIGFKEVEVRPREDGAAEHRLLLKDGAVPARISLAWHRVEDYFVSVATARPVDDGQG